AHHRMDEQMRAGLLAGPHGQLEVSPMHRIARLEGDDAPPAEPAELLAQLRWTEAKRLEVVVRRSLEAFDPPGDVPGMGSFEQVAYPGVVEVGGTEHRARLEAAIRFPHLVDVKHRQ